MQSGDNGRNDEFQHVGKMMAGRNPWHGLRFGRYTPIPPGETNGLMGIVVKACRKISRKHPGICSTPRLWGGLHGMRLNRKKMNNEMGRSRYEHS
jgi:hypothetical protein